MDIRIRHSTRYRFGERVQLGEHRLMLRPRDSFDLRILSATLAISPQATLAWRHDVYGNSLAAATFEEPAEELAIASELVLRRYHSAAPTPATGAWRTGAPVAYDNDERLALQPFMTPSLTDPSGVLSRFATEAVVGGSGHHPLIDLATVIHGRLGYRLRMDEGTQTPIDTLALGTGSCRDYAWLFIESARHLGYAARFVTGYLHDRSRASGSQAGGVMTAPSGYSHAWAEVYIPGDGWVEFDPTNELVADRQLIRVAVTRAPHEASPVSGSFIGTVPAPPPEVSVTIEELPRAPDDDAHDDDIAAPALASAEA